MIDDERALDSRIWCAALPEIHRLLPEDLGSVYEAACPTWRVAEFGAEAIGLDQSTVDGACYRLYDSATPLIEFMWEEGGGFGLDLVDLGLDESLFMLYGYDVETQFIATTQERDASTIRTFARRVMTQSFSTGDPMGFFPTGGIRYHSPVTKADVRSSLLDGLASEGWEYLAENSDRLLGISVSASSESDRREALSLYLDTYVG